MDLKPMLMNGADLATDGNLAKLERLGHSARDLAKVRKSAEDFEAIFFEQMLKTMRSSIHKSGLTDGGNAEEIYTSMLDGEYSKSLASQRSTGLADMIERQLLESMGVKSPVLDQRAKLHGLSSYKSGAGDRLQETGKRVTMDHVANIIKDTK